MPITIETPPIADAAWSSYIADASRPRSRRRSATSTRVTTRGEGGLASTMLVGEQDGLPVRIADRADRRQRDRARRRARPRDRRGPRRDADACGRSRRARSASTRAGRRPRRCSSRATPRFDERFQTAAAARSRSRSCSTTALRARATTTLDGWLAYWEREGLRYRVYPGRGAPLDHPMPLSDLALGRTATAPDRLVAVIELLVEIAQRGVERAGRRAGLARRSACDAGGHVMNSHRTARPARRVCAEPRHAASAAEVGRRHRARIGQQHVAVDRDRRSLPRRRRQDHRGGARRSRRVPAARAISPTPSAIGSPARRSSIARSRGPSQR